MISLWSEWVENYPIVLIEDALAENDWDGWKKLTTALGARVELVGDDIFCTNPAILRKAIDCGIGNSILIKLNQIGTVSETLKCVQLAQKNEYATYVSHRSGDTEDTFIADLAVATGCGHIKTGSGCRGERIGKFNRLLKIEHDLDSNARFAGPRRLPAILHHPALVASEIARQRRRARFGCYPRHHHHQRRRHQGHRHDWHKTEHIGAAGCPGDDVDPS